jgi:hypothetical protein
VKSGLRSVRADGATLWFPDSRPERVASPTAYLLSIYDELISSYRDRGAMIEPRHAKKLVGRGNALTAVIVVDGRIVGTFKRRMTAKAVTIETRPFEPFSRSVARALGAATRRYGEFLGLPVDLR